MSDINDINDETEIPKPTLIQGLQNIIRLPMDRKCKWTIVAYSINKDIIDEQGNVDPLRAIISCLGSYKTKDEAINQVKVLIEKTGHNNFKIIKYGMFAEITTNPTPELVTTITVDMKGKIMEMESEEFKMQKELYEKKVAFEKEMLRECELECNVDHIEHYKRAAYLVTKHYMSYLDLKNQMEQAYKNYELRKKVLKEHYTNHPEHEAQFLPYFKEKLESRGEQELYLRIEKAYLEHKHEFLN
jgi:hypothetical protein